jgi:SAM-dependent methyltransferase
MFAAVDAYDNHIGRYSPALARELIAAAGIKAGDRALDVGCGPGALTRELVAVLGADHVAAVDPSPAFVAATRSRFPDVRVEEASAESLPFHDASFDAALAQLVVNFMSDANVGVGAMKRVTRPGGVVGAAVWDYGGDMTLLKTFWDAVAAVGAGSGATDERNVRYSNPDSLLELWSQVGFDDPRVNGAVMTAGYNDFDDLWQGFEKGVGPAGAAAVSLAEEQRARLKDEYRRRLGVGDQPFELTARAWVVTGRVP